MVNMEGSEINLTVRNAVRHLKQLREDLYNNTFTDDDLNNIDYIADTLMALETEISKLYSDYETESIEASRFRHQLKLLPNAIKNEIQAAVTMARESNVSVIQKLQGELDACLQQVREYTEQNTYLNEAINTLQSEKSSLQQQYDTMITEVNQRLSEKALLQISLNETRDTVRETNEYTFNLEEDIMVLKQQLMQERNDARQEKVRLEEQIVITSKKFDEQEKANQLLKIDVDAESHKVSESELQLRTMYRERERFENENNEIRRKFEEQNDLYEMEQKERDRLLEERIKFEESCRIAVLDYQTKKASLEEREALAHARTNEETEILRTLKEQHDDLLKRIDDHVDASKTLENTIAETGRQLDEIKQDIAKKLEKTAKLNLDNSETTRELDAMREAHQMMIESLKLQRETLQKELNHIRETRISKQKERETLLKNIEQIKLTTRNNDIRHNRFVTQTTARVNDLSERKVILDRYAREDQLQIAQVGERLVNLKEDYRQMKIDFEQQIKYFEESTAQLLKTIEINRTKLIETTPEFEQLKQEHEDMITLYESVKETMIDTKRRKQDTLDKIASVQRDIREKNRSRDTTISAVKECQRETQERMQNASDSMLQLEEEIYEKGCRLETLEAENEKLQKTIDYLNNQINLFNKFSQQSKTDISNLDNNNHDLLDILETGWKEDRTVEEKSAAKDLEYIGDLDMLLTDIDKRKTKVSTVVYRLVGELQQLKYYLEGMSKPDESLRPDSSFDESSSPKSSSRQSPPRSKSNERSHSARTPPKSPPNRLKARQRTQSALRADANASAPTPIRLTDDIRQRVSVYVQKNFDFQSATSKKSVRINRENQSNGRQSARTDFSSWKSVPISEPYQSDDDNEQEKTTNHPKVAFA